MWFTAAMAGLQIAGTAAQAFGQYKQAQSAESTAKYNSAVSMQNAKLIMQSARLEMARARKDKRKFLDLQRVSFLKSGVTSEGTPFDMMVETASEMELDIQTEFFNAQVAANREIASAKIAEKEAAMYRAQKKIAPLMTISQGLMNLSGTLGGGAQKSVNTPKADPTGGPGTVIKTTSGFGVRHA